MQLYLLYVYTANISLSSNSAASATMISTTSAYAVKDTSTILVATSSNPTTTIVSPPTTTVFTRVPVNKSRDADYDQNNNITQVSSTNVSDITVTTVCSIISSTTTTTITTASNNITTISSLDTLSSSNLVRDVCSTTTLTKPITSHIEALSATKLSKGIVSPQHFITNKDIVPHESNSKQAISHAHSHTDTGI